MPFGTHETSFCRAEPSTNDTSSPQPHTPPPKRKRTPSRARSSITSLKYRCPNRPSRPRSRSRSRSRLPNADHPNLPRILVYPPEGSPSELAYEPNLSDEYLSNLPSKVHSRSVRRDYTYKPEYLSTQYQPKGPSGLPRNQQRGAQKVKKRRAPRSEKYSLGINSLETKIHAEAELWHKAEAGSEEMKEGEARVEWFCERLRELTGLRKKCKEEEEKKERERVMEMRDER
ncbi:MAG: hypothetical protein Q9221_008368 [Calogaya cf. arnoldii]